LKTLNSYGFHDLPSGDARYIFLQLFLDLQESYSVGDFDKHHETIEAIKEACKATTIVLDTPHESMFADATVRVSSDFMVTVANGHTVRLGDIHLQTIIFCPVHEPGAYHNPSAFVSISESGCRRIFCYVCSTQACNNRGVMEEIREDKDTLEQLAGSNHTFIESGFVTIDHIKLREDVTPKTPFTIVIKSGMGSGKTTLVRKLLTENIGATTLKRLMGKLPEVERGELVNVIFRILAILPRKLLTEYTAKQYGLKSIYQALNSYMTLEGFTRNWESCNSKLEEEDRLAVCIASLHRLKRSYDVVVMDEGYMAAELLISELSIPVSDIVDALEVQLSQCKVRIVMSAGKRTFYGHLF
jgi:nucleoside-triphosphatase THEP1